ncbi:MAG: hypothetical protein OXC30_05325 [Alphaproteobacteria bacterium]|nr:hypothetical protein [Alphaproteobacteria bacterium]
MWHLLLLIMIVLNVCAGTSASWDDMFFRLCDGTLASWDCPDITKDDSDAAKRCAKRGASERLPQEGKSRVKRERHSCAVKNDQEQELYFQTAEYLDWLPDDLGPEREVAQCIKSFLAKGEFLQERPSMKFRLSSWFREAFLVEKLYLKTLITYPFARGLMDNTMNLMDESVWEGHQYTSDIFQVMLKIYGIFCWEYKQSSLLPECVDALPRWKEEKAYPNVKQILHSWKEGPFPESFCGNIMFFMQNRARLESFGCDMNFLDDCKHHLPDSLEPFRPGACKYSKFYRDVFSNPGVYKKKIYDLMENLTACEKSSAEHNSSAEHIQCYAKPLQDLECFQKSLDHSAARWFFGLAERLMVAEILLGLRPSFQSSIQGIAAYINDRLEYVQFHPDYHGMNTATLNEMVFRLTKNALDLQLIKGSLQECGVVYPLNQKSHGLKRGILPFLLDQEWWPKHFAHDSGHFLQTKSAIGGLTKFGVSSDVVKSLQSSMDEKGMIPISLYYNPLTEDALNDFLKQCGKEPAVFGSELNVEQRTVECILHDMKLPCPESAEGQYVRYREFFACDRVITRNDLAELATVMIHYGDLRSASPFGSFLIVRTYIEETVLPKMLEEKKAILCERNKTEPLSDQSGQNEQRYADLQRKKEILDFFCANQELPPAECLIFQHINMLVLFLRSLGVELSHLAHTRREAYDIMTEVLDGCSLQNTLQIYDNDSQLSLEALSLD